MKRKIAWIMIAFLSFAGAFAETLYRGEDEHYYHRYALCGGVPDRAENENAFGVCLCPVCCGGQTYESPNCVERGGTYILRVPDAWIRKIPLVSVFAMPWEEEYTGSEAERLISELLHGQAYIDFIESRTFGGEAEAVHYVPSVPMNEGGFVMSQRHIGNNWYIVFRPEPAFDGTVYLRYFSGTMRWQDSTLTMVQDMETDVSLRAFRLTMTPLSGQGAVYHTGTCDLYYEMDTWIGVFRLPDAEDCADGTLHIEGFRETQTLDGYFDGTAAVFVAVLTDAEAAEIQSGKTAAIAVEPR